MILMKTATDCEVAAIANACDVSYEQARKALDYRQLGGLENPLLGNPWNLYRALVRLGFWKQNVTLTMLLTQQAQPKRTIILLHNPEAPILQQHWVTWHGKQGGYHLLAWGDSQQLRRVSDKQLTEYFTRGWPNCSFSVYKASVWRIIWERVKIKIKELFK